MLFSNSHNDVTLPLLYQKEKEPQQKFQIVYMDMFQSTCIPSLTQYPFIMVD
jgi:hypothetical protein